MFAALFDADGNELTLISANRLVRQTFSQRFFRRQFPDAGDYWFVWDADDSRGSGFYLISVYGPHLQDSKRREISYTNHAASFAHFDVETAISNHLRGTSFEPDMPPNVQAIVREHVSYREGSEHHTEGEDRFTIQTLPSDKIAERLAELSGKEAVEFGSEIGGRKVPIFELALAVTMFVPDDTDEVLIARCLRATVPWHKQFRLSTLMRLLGDQLASE